VKNFDLTGHPRIPFAPHKLATRAVSCDPNADRCEVEFNEQVQKSYQYSSTTTHGASAGIEFSFTESGKTGLPGLAEGGLEFTQRVNAGYNFSQQDAVTSSDTKSFGSRILASGKPGSYLVLDVFQTEGDLKYDYTADLQFGEAGKFTPGGVITPATVALNMSPATRHPCLAYVVGDATVQRSLMGIAKALGPDGGLNYTPERSELTADQSAFLSQMPNFDTKTGPRPKPGVVDTRKTEECPGFPAGFASKASFVGAGTASYSNAGYDKDGRPSTTLLGCVYATKPSNATTTQTTTTSTNTTSKATDDPCKELPTGSGTITASQGNPAGQAGSRRAAAGGAGVLIRARAARTQGTPVSDKVMGSDRDEEISPGAGAFEQVYARGGDDLVSGGPGQDLIQGGSGGDELDGGGGFDTMYGGDGRDTLREPGGAGLLSGEGGADTLIASGGHELTMSGGAGADRLISLGKSGNSLNGGPGNDRYVMTGPGKTTLFEAPGDGDDVLRTAGRVLVPPRIETTVATGGRPVELRSGYGRQTLIGNRAANVLAAGLDSDRVRGGRGSDRILLDEFGFDRVTGGNGADSFIPRGTPANADRPAGLEDPAHRTAHRITGFHPGRGDRIVMLASVFGTELLDHHKGPAIIRDHNPRPHGHHATILFDDRTGLVSFDRDGAGPISDKVVVLLPDGKTLKRNWLKIRR
jgi:Ca2+-binding RTX toxin-like protein